MGLTNAFCDAVEPHPADAEHTSIRKVCCSLDKFYNILYGGDMFLTLPEWTELDVCVRRLGRRLQLLRSIAETQNMPQLAYAAEGPLWPTLARAVYATQQPVHTDVWL